MGITVPATWSGASFHFCRNSTLVLVPVCGLKVFVSKPTTARIRAFSAINSRIYLSDVLLNLPCGNTIAILPPGFRKSKLRSINKISLSTLLCALPFPLKPRVYWCRMRFSLMFPAKGGFALKISKLNCLFWSFSALNTLSRSEPLP